MLESYITPLLFGYVNKYVKNLKPSDLNLSLWGGDVVLNNLELKLEVLHREIKLPIKFSSGKIAELRIHVPWTRLTTQPVVVTINTIEFVLTLTDPEDDDDNEINTADSINGDKDSAVDATVKQLPKDNKELSPGYVQGLLNKIMNNIQIKVNNVIIKYVEDDIVFSLNTRSAELFTTDSNWQPSFIDVTASDPILRRIGCINDLTVCLDQRNSNGMIEMYQDPVLFKCSFVCRMLSRYTNPNASKPSLSIASIHCETLDFSFTDQQLPLYNRLVSLLLSLYYGDLDLPGSHQKLHTAKRFLGKQHSPSKGRISPVPFADSPEREYNEDGWVNWAWSFIPPLADEEQISESNSTEPLTPSLVFSGMYCSQMSITVKITSKSADDSLLGIKRFEFVPVMSVELSGALMEMVIEGDQYFDMQVAVTSIVGYKIGECLCQQRNSASIVDSGKQTEDELFLTMNNMNKNLASTAFLDKSLFCVDAEKLYVIGDCYNDLKRPYNEQTGTSSFAAVYFNYHYKLTVSDNMQSSDSAINTSHQSFDESSQKRIVIGPSTITVTSGVYHLMETVHRHYVKDQKERPMKKNFELDSFALHQLKQGTFQTRGTNVTVNSLQLNILMADHSRGQKEKPDQAIQLTASINRIDAFLTQPMYPTEIKSLLLNTPSAKNAELRRSAVEKAYFKVFGFTCGFSLRNISGKFTTFNIAENLSASFFRKTNIYRLKKNTAGNEMESEIRIESPNFSIKSSKCQLFLLVGFLRSWSSPLERLSWSPNVDHITRMESAEHVLMNLGLVDLNVCIGFLNQGVTINIHVNCIHGNVVSKDRCKRVFLYGPLSTESVSSVSSILNNSVPNESAAVPDEPLISVASQLMPLTRDQNEGSYGLNLVSIRVKGIVFCIDDKLKEWIMCGPNETMVNICTSERRHLSKPKTQSSRAISTSTPKRRSYSRLYSVQPSSGFDSNPPNEGLQNKIAGSDKMANDSIDKSKSSQLDFLAWLESISGTVMTDNIVILFSDGSLLNPIKEDEPTLGSKFNILENFQMNLHAIDRPFPSTLLLCLPKLSISSSNATQIPPLIDLPLPSVILKEIPHSPTPWRGSFDKFSMLVLPEQLPSHQLSDNVHLLSPFSLDFCIASSKPLSNSQNKKNVGDGKEIGLVIHVNCNAMSFGFSPVQANAIINVVKSISNSLDYVITDIKRIYFRARQSRQPATSFSFDEEQSVQMTSDRLSSSSASTTNMVDDGTIVSTERNTTFSNITENEAASKALASATVSLWLQATIPKICVALNGSDSDKGSTILCLDEVTVSFDYQDGNIEAATKIDQTNAYFVESKWSLDPAKLESPPIDCLIACSSDTENKTHCFLTLKYTKSNSNHTRQLINGEWQSNLIEDLIYQSKSSGKLLIIEDTVCYQHSCSITIQSLDILVIPHTVNALFEILKIGLPSNQHVKSPVLERSPTESHNLGLPTRTTMIPLPTVDMTWSGCRILLPKIDPDPSASNLMNSQHNVCALQVQHVSITSSPENRISQSVVMEEWFGCIKRFAKAKNQDHTSYYKQYQLVIGGLSLWTGKYFAAESKTLFKVLTTQLQHTNPNLQNPALDWNKMAASGNELNDVTWNQVIDSFGFQITFAPAMVLLTKPTGKEIIVTSHSIEAVLLDDIICKASNEQIKFIVDLMLDLKTSSQSSMTDNFSTTYRPSHLSDATGKSSNISKTPTFFNLQEKPFAIGENTNEVKKSTQFFELFVSGKKLSLSLYKTSGAQYDPLLLPVVRICIMQPTLHYSCMPPTPKMVASIFTMSVCGSSTLLPTFDPLSCEECFDVSIMQTTHQNYDPATGLLPQAVALTSEGASLNLISVDVSHLVTFNIPLKWLNQTVPIVVSIMNNFSATDTKSKQEPSNPIRSTTRKLIVHSRQINVFIFQCSMMNHPQLEIKIGPKVSGTLMQKIGSESSSYWKSSVVIDIDSLCVRVAEQSKMHIIMSPSFFQCRWYHNVWNEISRDIICIDNETLKFRLASKTLMLLKEILDGFELPQDNETSPDLMKEKYQKKNDEHSNNQITCQVYEDDLRGGNLSYIIAQDKQEQRARPNQILFSNDSATNTRWMTWHYREPRILTECLVMPLPFNIDETRVADENLLIPCLLQYWSDASQSFVDYQEFVLSEIKACQLHCDSVDVPSDTFSTAVVAEEWRVIVDYAKMCASMDGIVPFIPIASASLAACMKLTSCYQPHRIAKVAFHLSSQSTQVDLAVDVSLDSWGPPTTLNPFFLDIDTYPLEQELVHIYISTLHINGIVWPNLMVEMSSQMDMSVFAMNYCYLMWQEILNTSDAGLRVKQGTSLESTDPVLYAAIHFGLVNTTLTPSVINTLSVVMDHWTAKKTDSRQPLVIPHHYVICNDTQETILFGQATTPEEIHLASGQLYPYSWYCNKNNEAMWLAIESSDAVAWSSPFSIDHTGVQVIKTIVNQLQCEILVEVINITGIQKQIIIKGIYSLSNRTNCVLEFMITQSNYHGSMQGRTSFCNFQKQYVVQNNVTRPSLVLDTASAKSIALRIGNESVKNNWSKEFVIPTTSEIVDSGKSYAVELLGVNGLSHYWLTFTKLPTKNHVSIEKGFQVVVSVCPLFVIRNHLHCPITMSIKGRDNADQQCTLVVEGQGNETEISELPSSLWYNVTFQLPGDNTWSSPPVPMNSSLMSLIEMHQTEEEYYQSIDPADSWPYVTLFSPIESNSHGRERRSYATSLSHTVCTQSGDASGDDNESYSTKFRCEFVRRWKGLPTIILELKPVLLIMNKTKNDIYITCGTNQLISRIENGMTVSPETVTDVFKLGINHRCTGDSIHWSDPIALQSLEDSQPPVYAHSGKLLPDDSTTCNFLISVGDTNVCIQLSLCSKICFGLRVISIKERFSVHNMTCLPLVCYPVLAETCSIELDPVGIEGVVLAKEDTSDVSSLIVKQRKSNDSKISDQPVTQKQLSNWSMSFYFSASNNSRSNDLLTGLHLSEEHLREVIDLTDESGVTHPIAMTSSQFEGVIHLYLALDSAPFLTIVNHCPLSAALKVCMSKGDVSPSCLTADTIKGIGITVPPSRTRHWLPEVLKERFPRLDAIPDYRIQIGLVKDTENGSIMYFSDPLSFNDTTESPIKVDDNLYVATFVKQGNGYSLAIDLQAQHQREANRIQTLTSQLKVKVEADDITVVIATEQQGYSSLPVASIGFHICSIGYYKMDNIVSQLEIEVGTIQIDNRLDEKVFDFPVVFSPLQQQTPSSNKESMDSGSSSYFKETDDGHFSHFKSTINLRSYNSSTLFERLTVTISPSELYLEDLFWSHLCEIAPLFCPPTRATTRSKQCEALDGVHKTAAVVLNPLNLGEIVINDVNLLLSVHASVKVYLSTDHMPLVLGKYASSPSLTVHSELSRTLMYHYATQVLVRAGWMLGSFEIIGNPTGLLNNFGKGLSDFVAMPYNGLIRGPTSFVSGIGMGISSLIRHLSTGTILSMSDFASSMSRNLDRLSLDEHHMEQQQLLRSGQVTGPLNGFGRSLSGLGISLLGAVGGIVDHPMRKMQNADDFSSAVTGLLSGLGVGMMGVLTKPIGGAMEIVSQTGQGVLHGAGLLKLPQSLNLDKKKTKSLVMKHSGLGISWSVLRCFHAPVFFLAEGVRILSDCNKACYNGIIALNVDCLYICGTDTCSIIHAINNNQISMELKMADKSHHSILLLTPANHQTLDHTAKWAPITLEMETIVARDLVTNILSIL